jgi:DNA-binding MarR family transcriptional regulator
MKIRDQDIIEFHKTIMDLIKKYQFRNRNQITCYGISVSQCYILETLYTYGPLTMKELAKKMHLDISTITRVVKHLVNKKLVTKNQGLDDLRIRRLILTENGKDLYMTCWKSVFESEKKILEKIKPESRGALIGLLKELNRSVDQWQQSCKVR